MNKGYTLIEVLVATTILGVMLTVFISSYANLTNSQVRSRLLLEATQYAREGVEISYNLSQRDWDYLVSFVPADVEVYPIVVGGSYALSSGTEPVGGKFIRGIKVEWARRDGSGNIVEDGSGTQDNTTLKIMSRIYINGSPAPPFEIISYATNPKQI